MTYAEVALMVKGYGKRFAPEEDAWGGMEEEEDDRPEAAAHRILGINDPKMDPRDAARMMLGGVASANG